MLESFVGVAKFLWAALLPLPGPLLHLMEERALFRLRHRRAKKAWLQSKDDPFPKTHDLEVLVEQAAGINPDFGRFAKAASVLTPYVSAFRYPGGSDEPMPTREEFDEAEQHAQAIHGFVLNLLPTEARP